MNVSPINNSDSYKQSFKAKIPYSRKVDAAFNYAEKLLTTTNHRYNPYDAEDILIHPSPKLIVHDFCENIKYLLSEQFRPNETLELGFKYYNASTYVPRSRMPWMFHWRTLLKMKDSKQVREMSSSASTCDFNADLKRVKEQACFDALNSFGYNKRCPEPDLRYYSESRLNEMREQELKQRNQLEEHLTIDNVKAKLLEIKEQLMKNTVFERESIAENPKDNMQLARLFNS